MGRPLFALALVPLGACFYVPGSYSSTLQPFAGERVDLHCLDLALTLMQDRTAPPPIVQYSFGNRCAHSTVVDLASVRVVGRGADGIDRALHAYDPKHELAALAIDGWWHGREEIAYAVDGGGPPPQTVCAEVGHVDRGEPAPRDRWVCLGMVEVSP